MSRTHSSSRPPFRRRLTAILLAAVAFGGSTVPAEHGWAKHHKTPHGSTDPCAPLNTSMQKRITQMKALKTDLEKEKAVPNTLVGVFDLLQGKPYVDKEKTSRMAEIRHEAEDIDTLLEAAGCPRVDIDRELAKP
jgi:hypothetical protein